MSSIQTPEVTDSFSLRRNVQRRYRDTGFGFVRDFEKAARDRFGVLTHAHMGNIAADALYKGEMYKYSQRYPGITQLTVNEQLARLQLPNRLKSGRQIFLESPDVFHPPGGRPASGGRLSEGSQIRLNEDRQLAGQLLSEIAGEPIEVDPAELFMHFAEMRRERGDVNGLLEYVEQLVPHEVMVHDVTTAYGRVYTPGLED
jgi:hypothetical protein